MVTSIKKLFESEDFEKMYEKTVLDKCHYLKIKSPLAVQFELTSGCNQNCIFCYNVWKNMHLKQNAVSLPRERQLEVIDVLVKNEIFSIIFSGGEPLITPCLEELIKKCSDAKMDTTVITNGVLITESRAKSLKESGLDDMQISLHHHIPEINDKQTGVKGSFEKTVKGIKNALLYFPGGEVNVNMVALPETYKDVYALAEFLHSIGVVSFSVGSPSVTGEMKADKKLVIDKKMFLEVHKQLKKAKKDFNINVGFSGGFPLCLLPEINKESLKMVGNYCDAGLNQVIIGPEGELRPCVCLGENLGNILTDDLSHIWKTNKFLLDIRKLKFIPDVCKECSYVSICRGGCRASAQGYFGKLNAIDPLMK